MVHAKEDEAFDNYLAFVAAEDRALVDDSTIFSWCTC